MDTEIVEKIIMLIVIIVVDYYLIRTTMKGAPFAPTTPAGVTTMLALARVRAGEKAADLGSGDGRLVIALARAGAEAHGFEINPVLVAISRWKIRRAGLAGKASIHRKSYWRENLSAYTLITVFGIPYIMKPLEEKLKKELPVGSRVVSNCFSFPSWKCAEARGKIRLYKRA